MPLPDHPAVTALVSQAGERGLNLVGLVGRAEFDACQPPGRRAADLFADCGTIVLVGHGGSSLWEHVVEAESREGRSTLVPRPEDHPIDRYSADAARDLIETLSREGIRAEVTQPDSVPSLNFLHLAELAGWGTVSPVVGMLLHREYGPWVSMRAALLVEGQPFGPCAAAEHEPFEPCLRCHKPCVKACPVEVFDGMGGIQMELCAGHRHRGHCATGCDVRRACPIGADARYGPDEEAFRHSYSLFSMRHHYGLK